MLHKPIDLASRWCILRTSAARTLGLAASLQDAGYETWTPVDRVTRRKSRSRGVVEFDAPMLPTYVFARAVDAAVLVHVSKAFASPHPAFSVYQHGGRAPLVDDRALNGLRLLEERSLDRAQRRGGKKRAQTFAPGDHVRVAEGQTAWQGMSGIVERTSGRGREAWIDFGGTRSAKIACWLLIAGGAALVPPPGKRGAVNATAIAA